MLLEAGADPNDGQTVYNNTDIASWLGAAGADTSTVDPLTAFVGACLADERQRVRAAVADDPTILMRARTAHPDVIRRAAELGRPDAAALLVELGFALDDVSQGSTALHAAAWRGDRAMVDALIACGADPTVVDSQFDGTLAGWAHHGGHPDLATLLDGLASQRPTA